MSKGNVDLVQRILGILAYCSWLVIIPLLLCKNSKFLKAHVNSGLVLAVAELILAIVGKILGGIAIIGILIWVLGIVFGVVSIIGIIYAILGKDKPLPVIGGFRIIK